MLRNLTFNFERALPPSKINVTRGTKRASAYSQGFYDRSENKPRHQYFPSGKR